ncbi:MAG: DNA translocase FtsK [Flavobacteriaceae bacterium]|nr:DNA translocase FtsK [Flavobacteriaceae bacterium]
MASKKKPTKKITQHSKSQKIKEFINNKQTQLILAFALMIFGIFIGLSIISFFLNWQADQSQLAHFYEKAVPVHNVTGKLGAKIGHLAVFNGFGIAALLLPVLIFISGLHLYKKSYFSKLKNYWGYGTLVAIWISLLFGVFALKNTLMAGIVGYELRSFLASYIGNTGIILLLIASFISFMVLLFKLTNESFKMPQFALDILKPTQQHDPAVETSPKARPTPIAVNTTVKAPKSIPLDIIPESNIPTETASTKNPINIVQNNEESFQHSESNLKENNAEVIDINETDLSKTEETEDAEETEVTEENVAIDIETVFEEDAETKNLSDQLVEDFGEFDPTLELGNFKFPTLNLLKEYNEIISVNQEELEINKNRIVETLRNYKIGIAQISATVGPTVTLYEIVPEAGIRISKIKNLEDDIALSLAALGIRIIAPIPGKGTIGIEVPNKKPTIVSMRAVIASKVFQSSEMELPIALGKTISNETFVVDLAKMPHLLMAGATGQGKSVGLNAVLTSLLYKKHPAEVKFVLVDPKKVELTLFNKIERHYLAKLPDSEEAIITDTTKVVNTLNSLCIEMDQRYDLLKLAMVRNIKEYNVKFKARKLNPENGHKYLPYIVLVIDEFADLIMTAGKEVETPIARLAQLARAIGIHLIVATQRPSVNVITGIIKANFPARIAFRVTSKIDSRTILDGSGADQLIGKGDMLYSGGNEMVRIQCAFVDTPEVERITDFIGSQRAYPDAYLLPEYIGEETGTGLDVDITDRDKLFRDAALVIIHAQQGSASLLQRKLKLGYNRAGRIIDQLEAAGIVGQFEGSKARQVLVQDEMALNTLLDNETIF